MAKRNFKPGIDSLIQDTKKNIEIDNEIDMEKSKHLKVKGTYYFDAGLLHDAKSVAYHSRVSIGEVLQNALKMYLTNCNNLEEARKIYSQKA